MEELIRKWYQVSQEGLVDLLNLMPEPRPELTELIDHLGLDHSMIGYNKEDQSFTAYTEWKWPLSYLMQRKLFYIYVWNTCTWLDSFCCCCCALFFFLICYFTCLQIKKMLLLEKKNFMFLFFLTDKIDVWIIQYK